MRFFAAPITRLVTPWRKAAVGSSRWASAERYASMSSMGRRATPESIAALATKGGTYQIRRGSKGAGMM